jgi:hypothetical protein
VVLPLVRGGPTPAQKIFFEGVFYLGQKKEREAHFSAFLHGDATEQYDGFWLAFQVLFQDEFGVCILVAETA